MAPGAKKKIGEILIALKMINEEQLQEGLRVQKDQGGRIGEVLLSLGYLCEEDLTKVLSIDLGKEFVPSNVLKMMEVEDEALKMIPREAAERYSILPFGYHAGRETLVLCTHHPLTEKSVRDLVLFTKVEAIEISLGLKTSLDQAIKVNYDRLAASAPKKSETEDTGEGFYLGSDDDAMMFPGVYHIDDQQSAAAPAEAEVGEATFGTVTGDLRPPYQKDLPKEVEFGTVDGELSPADDEMAFPGIYSFSDDGLGDRAAADGGRKRPAGVEGTLEEMAVPDIVQILGAGNKTRALHITNKEGEYGLVHIENGRVVNAEFKEQKGAEAFYEIVTWESGTFRIDPNVVITERPIENSNDWLIMEALRLYDEKQRGNS